VSLITENFKIIEDIKDKTIDLLSFDEKQISVKSKSHLITLKKTDFNFIDNIFKDLEVLENCDDYITPPASQGRCNTVHFCPGPFPNPHPGRNYGTYYDGRCEFLGRNFISYPILTSSVPNNKRKLFTEMNFDIFAKLPKIKIVDDVFFRKWFGNYTQEKREKILDIMRGIMQEKICKTYHISQNHPIPTGNDVYAYIITSRNYDRAIYLKNLFYTLPEYGLNSQYGTFIHELSHGYGDTEDHRYGFQDCLRLAITRPDLAVENADNYQFYIEEKIFSTNKNAEKATDNLPSWWNKIYNYKLSENKAPIANSISTHQKERRWGYINSKGKLEIKPMYYSAGFYSEGLAAVGITIDNDLTKVEIGFINEKNELVIINGDAYQNISTVYDSVNRNFDVDYMPYFKNGYAIVNSFVKNRKVYIDKTGYILEFNNSYLPVTNFTENNIAIAKEIDSQNYTIINSKGLKVPVIYKDSEFDFKPIYSRIPYKLYDSDLFNFVEANIYILKDKNTNNSYYFLFDEESETLTNVQTEFGAFSPFNKGKALAFKGVSQQVLINNKFSQLKFFHGANSKWTSQIISEDTITVYSSSQRSNNENIFNFEKDKFLWKAGAFKFGGFDIKPIQNGLLKAKFKGKIGFFNATGKQITDFVYNEMGSLENDLICASSTGAFGETQYRYINKKGTPIVYFS